MVTSVQAAHADGQHTSQWADTGETHTHTHTHKHTHTQTPFYLPTKINMKAHAVIYYFCGGKDKYFSEVFIFPSKAIKVYKCFIASGPSPPSLKSCWLLSSSILRMDVLLKVLGPRSTFQNHVNWDFLFTNLHTSMTQSLKHSLSVKSV